MKRLLGVVFALLLSASVANAGALADNDQFQAQGDGGFAGTFIGIAGGVGGAAAGQVGGGFAVAGGGDNAMEIQHQEQAQIDFVSADDGNGNFAAHGWDTSQSADSGSIVNGGGIAGNIQGQGLVGGSAGVTAWGVGGVAGSAGAALGGSGSFALGNAAAFNTQDQNFTGAYEQQSVNGNGGYVYQTGTQSFGTQTSSGAFAIGAGGAVAGVVQAGGTVVSNNGQGTYMEGHGTAAGEAFAAEGSIGIATADAAAYGIQTHNYEQANISADGTSAQFQSGTVHTSVFAD